MQIIIDANIVLSMLIRSGKPVELFFNERLQIYAPQLLLTEISNNLEDIKKKSVLDEEEIDAFLGILKKNIMITPEHEFVRFRKKARDICPDPKDIVYFALALHLQCPIWSNEKILKNQNTIDVHATHELMQLLE